MAKKDLSRFEVDYDAVEKEQEEKEKEEEQRRGNREHIWKPQSGKNVVRVIPYRHAKHNYPIIQLYFHYRIGDETIVCPEYNLGEKCPICEYIENRLSVRVSREDFILLSNQKAKLRYHSPVIDRNEEDNGMRVRFWGYSQTVFEDIDGYRKDPDYAPLFSPVNGRDFLIEHTPPDENPRKTGNYGKTKVRPRGKATPIFSDFDEIEELLEGVPEIMDFFPVLEFKKIEKKFNAFISGSEEEELEDEDKSEEFSEHVPLSPFNDEEEGAEEEETIVEKDNNEGSTSVKDEDKDEGDDFESQFASLFGEGEDE